MNLLKRFFFLFGIGCSFAFSSEDVVKREFPAYSVHKHEPIDLIEACGDGDIYHLDETYIVKVYSLDDSISLHRFEREKRAFLFANSHTLPIVTLLDVKMVSHEGKEYGILFMEKADGKSLNRLIKEYCHLYGNKKEQLKQLKIAMKSIAKGLGKLHQVKDPLRSNIKNYSDTKLVNDFLTHMNECNIKISKEKLRNEFLKRSEGHTPIIGLTHKDLHPGNIFISDKNEMQLIDITSLQTSDVTYDMVNFISHFEAICHFNHMDETVIQLLMNEFIEEYTKHIQISKKQYDYQRLLMSIELLYDYSDISDISLWAKNNLRKQLS